jgi:hypothetical protein
MIFFVFMLLGLPAIGQSIYEPEETLSPLEMFSTNSDYGAQRCASSDCTCRVNLPRIQQDLEIQTLTVSETVYFEESNSQISTAQRSRVIQYLEENSSQRYFTVTGYTDGCGGNNYNYGLAARRASAVRSLIKSLRPEAVVSTRAVAELSSRHDSRARKVDITSQSTRSEFPAYPEIIADVYLIDASGSMSGTYRRWLAAISQSRPYGSKVYVSYARYCHSGQSALTVSPGGGTEIWYSYWHILDSMSSGQTLAIISDFDAQVPLTSSERQRIERKVQQRSVRVIAITP